MTATIISEDILERFICSVCYKYLSYGETKIAKTVNITCEFICGRCDQTGCLQSLPTNEQFNNYLFPCINRFDNCTMLLHRSEVPNHEKVCRIKSNVCEECDFQGNGCQIYHHYLDKHEEKVLKVPVLLINLYDKQCSRTFLHRKNNNLFRISMDISGAQLKFSISTIGFYSANSQIKYQLHIQSTKMETIYFETSKIYTNKIATSPTLQIKKLEKQSKEGLVVCKFDFFTSGDLFSLNIPVPEESPQQNRILSAVKNSLFPKLICVNCNSYSLIPIVRCPKSHVKCSDCKTFFCKSCKEVENWSRASDLEAFHAFFPLPCRFCSELFFASDLRNHEKKCPKRVYECVELWCKWRGNLDSVENHGHSMKIPFNKDSVCFYGYQENFVESWIMFDCEVFYVRFDPLSRTGRDVHIRKISNVVTDQKYTGRVKITHECDGRIKEFNFDLNFGGISNIARYYFDYFGECKNYKMIVYVKNYTN